MFWTADTDSLPCVSPILLRAAYCSVQEFEKKKEQENDVRAQRDKQQADLDRIQQQFEPIIKEISRIRRRLKNDADVLSTSVRSGCLNLFC